MKKFNTMILIIALMFGIVLTGCKGKEEEKKNEVEKPPSSLEELQTLSDGIVMSTMKKDWSGSLTSVKEVQSKWSELYPDLQKKGVSKDDVDAFVSDLNQLSDALIAKTMTLPKETKTQEKSQDSQQQESQSQETGQGSQQSNGSGQQSHQASTQPQESGQQEEQDAKEGTEEKNKDPQKALEEIDPLLEIKPDELIIVDNSVELLQHIPKFSGLFGGNIPADVLQLKYLLYHVNVTSKQNNWEETYRTMDNISDIWKSVEPKALDADESIRQEIAQSIKEVEDVVKQKKDKLIGMKSNNTLEIIQKLVKAFEEKK